jgi:UDP-N-acetylmuramate dehydrogenase
MALEFAQTHGLPYWIMGGGSNTIVSDGGYPGLVLRMEIEEIESISSTSDFMTWTIGAGVNWDDFVLKSLKDGLVGVECLSGIPGTVGASPIQNIGAYGQEVSDTIESIQIITPNFQSLTVSAEECNFQYRNSRFKSGDWDRYIITHVTFKLSKKKDLTLKYPEVQRHWEEDQLTNLITENRIKKLLTFREFIIQLRKSKSMVMDETDQNSKSVGSFFTNPFLSEEEKNEFLICTQKLELTPPTLYFDQKNSYKISAAWLIENAGFKKGFRKNGIGISSAHSLALININGTTKDLLDFAEEIRSTVFKQFKINLSKEPVLLD